ncbi:MAG: hypothetical protein WD425_20130 [Nitrospirales bacterium]
MKKVLKIKTMMIAGSVAGLCLVGSVALANPSLVPDHPGYPMSKSKSPVSNVPTANDPGQEAVFGQKALDASTRAGNEDQLLHSRSSLLEDERMRENKMREGQTGKHQENQMGKESQMERGN